VKDQAKTDTPDTKRTEPAASDTPSTSTETPKAP